MSDPLSAASGVAGLICLGAATSKLFYLLFMSAVGAPNFARGLASALFTLNASLGQVQEVLLDPNFVHQSNDSDIDALEGCLLRCTKLFREMDSRIGRTGLAEATPNGPKRTWESIKMVYKEEELEEALRRIAEEKATLALILDAFTARMTAGILEKVEHLQVLAKKQDRRLKDIHVWCQWATGKFTGCKATDCVTEYSGFTASQAYTSNDMQGLLHSSGSVLSLQLGDLSDDSVSIIWTPESASTISARQVRSTLSPKQLTLEDLKSTQRVMVTDLSPESEMAVTMTPLQSLADIYALAERSNTRRSRRTVSKALDRVSEVLQVASGVLGDNGITLMDPFGMRGILGSFEKHIIMASAHNHSMIWDLDEIRNLILTIDYAGGDPEIEEKLQGAKEAIFQALSEYMSYATKVFQARTSKHLVKELTGEYETKRTQLIKNMKRAVKDYRFRYQVCTGEKLLRQQREMLQLTRKSLVAESTQSITVLNGDGVDS